MSDDFVKQMSGIVHHSINNPLWTGPEDPDGGVTQSLLGRFLSCRERFKLYVVDGLRPLPCFNHRIEYGTMWHLCEQMYIENVNWEPALKDHCKELCNKYRSSQEDIEKWYQICKLQFPLYVDWWKLHSDMMKRKPLLQEEVFKVAYTLPSKRVVYLRGRWDAIDIIVKDGKKGIWLQENKTKGDPDRADIERQLTFDLQTMLYLVAMRHSLLNGNIAGVRYNVIRRPLSGGKGNIVRKKGTKNTLPESKEGFYRRLSGIIKDAVGAEWGCPPGEHYFFMRWNIEISQKDIDTFCRTCLDPILEQLCWWYDTVVIGASDRILPAYAATWRHPFGVVNPIDEYGHSDLDEFLNSGSTIGLHRATSLFTELE